MPLAAKIDPVNARGNANNVCSILTKESKRRNIMIEVSR